MKTTKLALVAAIATLGATSAVAGEVLSQRQAYRQLYRAGKNTTQVRILRPDLVPDVYKAALQKAATVEKYYEAFAVSPTEGMLAKSGTQAINFHSAAAAQNAAISGCNIKKAEASADCVVVAEFLPKRYRGAKGLTLSYNATRDFTKVYRRARRPKAFAISPSTGNWGMALKAASDQAAAAAALATCNSKPSGNGDCVLTVAD